MRSRKNITENTSLNSYKPIRTLLCNLIDKSLLSVRVQQCREVAMFMKLYESNGKDCPYLLALCKAIHTSNEELYKQLIETKVENGK